MLRLRAQLRRAGGTEPGPGRSQLTVRLHTDNGMERLVVMRTNQMFDDDGQLSGVVATIKDITEEAAPQKREVIAESGPHARNDEFRAARGRQRSHHHPARRRERHR